MREVGGRPVSHSKKITLFPDDVLLGVAAMQGKDEQTLDVRTAAIRPDDSPAALETVQVTLEKELGVTMCAAMTGTISPIGRVNILQ